MFFKSAGALAAVEDVLARFLTRLKRQSRAVVVGTQALAFKHNPRLTPIRGYRGQDVSCDSALSRENYRELYAVGFSIATGRVFERGTQRYQHWFDGDGMGANGVSLSKGCRIAICGDQQIHRRTGCRR